MGLKRSGFRKPSNYINKINVSSNNIVKDEILNAMVKQVANKKEQTEEVDNIQLEVASANSEEKGEEIIEMPSKPIDETINKKDEVIEEIIEEPIKTPPEPSDEVIEVYDDKPNKVTEEDLKKILEEEENKTDEDRQVICLDTLEVYANSKEASAKTGANAGAITRNCRGYTKKAGGKRWQFYNDYLLENR